MRTVPRRNQSKILYFKTHVPKWAENAEALGLSAETIAELQAKTEAANALANTQREVQSLLAAKTAALNNALDKLSNLGAAAIQTIRARAKNAGPEVYLLGWLSQPEKGSPVAPPGKPEGLRLELMDGWLSLRWTCANPRGSSGTMYYLHRSLDGGAMAFLGISGAKTFVDQTVPAGTTTIVYRIQSFRSTKLGTSSDFPVTLTGLGKQPGMSPPGRAKRKTMLAA